MPGVGTPGGTPHRVACHWAEAVRDGELQPRAAAHDPAAVAPA